MGKKACGGQYLKQEVVSSGESVMLLLKIYKGARSWLDEGTEARRLGDETA